MSKRGIIVGHLSDTPLKRRLWVINHPIWFQRPDGRVLEMPPHFITDYASSPRALWWLIPTQDGVYDVAAAFHDYCVRCRKVLGYSLMECHKVFLEVLQAQHVPKWQERGMYGTVVAFNWMRAGKGDGSLPKYIKLDDWDLAFLEDIKAAFPWRVNW